MFGAQLIRRSTCAAAALCTVSSLRIDCAPQSNQFSGGREAQEDTIAHATSLLSIERERQNVRDVWIFENRHAMYQISQVINATLDIPFFNEQQESSIFEYVVTDCIRCVLRTLPKAYTDLMGNSRHQRDLMGIQQHGNQASEDIDNATAYTLKRRLLAHTRSPTALVFTAILALPTEQPRAHERAVSTAVFVSQSLPLT